MLIVEHHHIYLHNQTRLEIEYVSAKGEMEVGKEGGGGGQGVGGGEDSAGRARRAFEDDWTTAWVGWGDLRAVEEG